MSLPASVRLVSERAAAEVFRIGELRFPNEACGVILGDVVYELPNRSERPRNEYLMVAEDWPPEILEWVGFQDMTGNTDNALSRLKVWHTHQRLVGPSEMDIELRRGTDSRIRFLVFTLFVNEVREF